MIVASTGPGRLHRTLIIGPPIGHAPEKGMYVRCTYTRHLSVYKPPEVAITREWQVPPGSLGAGVADWSAITTPAATKPIPEITHTHAPSKQLDRPPDILPGCVAPTPLPAIHPCQLSRHVPQSVLMSIARVLT